MYPGFPTPLTDWINGDAKSFVMDILGSKQALERDIIDNKIVRDSLDKEGKYSRKVWGLLNLEIWQREFHDRNSYFKSLGLVFTIFRSIRARDYISYEVSKTICNNIFGLKISVYPNNKINIEYLSSCKNKSGSEILGRIKKFACKIDCREIKLDDGQYLDVKVLPTSIEESNEVFWIEDFCYIDIATTGDSWYNKMGFHRKEGNPIEDKLRNEELSKIPLIEIINNESDIVAFQKAFEIDTDINIYDSINKIFIIIKRDYLKNKRKPLTIDQFNIINHIISKYLKHILFMIQFYIIIQIVIYLIRLLND
jgi:hypothetical protein